MTTEIRWAGEEKREIIITKTEQVEVHTTLENRERDLAMAKDQVIKAQQTVATLEAEVAEIKQALSIPEKRS